MTRTEELTSELQQICARHERKIRATRHSNNDWTWSPNRSISRAMPYWAKFVTKGKTWIPECVYREALRAFESIWNRC